MLQELKSQLDNSMTTVRRFLQRPIKLDEGNISLGVSKSGQRDKARREARQRVRQIRRDLYVLLSQHPSSRKLMRNLAAVEQSLRGDDLQSLEGLPLKVIARALTEMESLVWDWSPVGLAELRSRLAVIVKTRPRNSEPAELDAAPAMPVAAAVNSDFYNAQAPVVTEVDHAEFEEMERSWVGFIPAARAPEEAVAA